MAQKKRLVIIDIKISNKKITKLEKFLKNLKKKGELVRVWKSEGEISEIGGGQTKRFESNHYEIVVCGGNKKAKEFIHSLDNLIPEGKQRIVYGFISDKFIRQ